jgi:hypothetical protein
MTKKIFSGAAWVEIQGDQVLHLNHLRRKRAEYQVLGFGEPISLVDFRPDGLSAIRQLLKSKKVADFAARFSSPAQVKILESRTKGVVIELYRTKNDDPTHRLWIAIGIGNRIPVYDYIFDRLEPLDDERFAFLALLRRADEVTSLVAAASV